jgi:hypothetical protein
MNFEYRISKFLTLLFKIRCWVFDINSLNLMTLGEGGGRGLANYLDNLFNGYRTQTWR